jgi:hypothetical protein
VESLHEGVEGLREGVEGLHKGVEGLCRALMQPVPRQAGAPSRPVCDKECERKYFEACGLEAQQEQEAEEEGALAAAVSLATLPLPMEREHGGMAAAAKRARGTAEKEAELDFTGRFVLADTDGGNEKMGEVVGFKDPEAGEDDQSRWHTVDWGDSGGGLEDLALPELTRVLLQKRDTSARALGGSSLPSLPVACLELGLTEVPTCGDGDCLAHAVLGVPGECIKPMLELDTRNHSDWRRDVADVMRSSKGTKFTSSQSSGVTETLMQSCCKDSAPSQLEADIEGFVSEFEVGKRDGLCRRPFPNGAALRAFVSTLGAGAGAGASGGSRAVVTFRAEHYTNVAEARACRKELGPDRAKQVRIGSMRSHSRVLIEKFEGMDFPVQIMDMEAARAAVDSPGSICVLYTGSEHGAGHYTRYTKAGPRAAAALPTPLAIAGARKAAAREPPASKPAKKAKGKQKAGSQAKPAVNKRPGGTQLTLPFGKSPKKAKKRR